MKTKLLGLVVVTALAFTSCKKDSVNNNTGNKSIDEISAPAGFSWSGSRDVRLSIGITDTRFQNQIHVVKIYDGDPAKGGELLSSGSATLITPFNTTISLSSSVRQLYIQKIAPSNAIITQTLQLTSDLMSLTIGENGILNAKSLGRPFGEKISALRPNITIPLELSPNCDAPYDMEITSQTSGEFELLAGKVYVIKQNNVNIYFNKEAQAGTTLRICGSNVTIGNFKIKTGTTLIVAASAQNVNLSSNLSYQGTGTFKNFGETTIGNITVDGTLVNQGTLKTDVLTVGANSSLVNTGSLTSGNFIANAPYSNSGSFLVQGTFTANANAIGKSTNTITVNSNADISAEFSSTGTFIIKGELQLKSGSDFSNTGTITVAGNTSVEGEFASSGNITFNGSQIDIKASSLPFANSGTITTVNNTRMLIASRTVVNSGTVKVGELHINSGGKIINNCKWMVTNANFKNEINGPLENNSYFSSAGGMNINSNGKISLGSKSMLITDWIGDSFAEKIEATGDTAVLKVNNLTQLQNWTSTAKFSGKLHVIYPSTLPLAMFEAGAVQRTSEKTIYIAAGGCMETGTGTAPPPPPATSLDSDQDGVPDETDEFDNDDTRAHRFYSENYNQGGSTLAFEDSWPLRGDYDLNDVVINYKYEYITDAANKVVDIKATYILVATGGNFQNGFGVEFPVAANNMTITSSSITPAPVPAPQQSEIMLESGQDKAVLILFQNSRQKQLTWNTQSGVASSPVVKFEVTLHLTDGPLQSDFGTGPNNPFIWNNSAGYGRGYETHLFGMKPTNKANTAIFGTGDDRTGGVKFYATDTNLPWAIALPIAAYKTPSDSYPIFSYPLETVTITEGYKMFADWAISGGLTNGDWYSNPGSTYRDTNKLYSAN